jgi:hypothetical protein
MSEIIIPGDMLHTVVTLGRLDGRVFSTFHCNGNLVLCGGVNQYLFESQNKDTFEISTYDPLTLYYYLVSQVEGARGRLNQVTRAVMLAEEHLLPFPFLFRDIYFIRQHLLT